MKLNDEINNLKELIKEKEEEIKLLNAKLFEVEVSEILSVPDKKGRALKPVNKNVWALKYVNENLWALKPVDQNGYFIKLKRHGNRVSLNTIKIPLDEIVVEIVGFSLKHGSKKKEILNYWHKSNFKEFEHSMVILEGYYNYLPLDQKFKYKKLVHTDGDVKTVYYVFTDWVIGKDINPRIKSYFSQLYSFLTERGYSILPKPI